MYVNRFHKLHSDRAREFLQILGVVEELSQFKYFCYEQSLKWSTDNTSMPVISGTFDIPKLKKKKEETWWERQLKDATDGSVGKEMAIGGVTGWCAGVVFSKVGKTAASALAGGLLMFQIAQHQGYIKVNWKKVNGDIEKAKRQLNKDSKKQINSFLEETKSFIHDYKFLVTGFAGGFFLGVAMCKFIHLNK